MIRQLDHVNIRTSNLSAMVRFYTDVVGLQPGARPPLGFPGAWLYAQDCPVVHLVEVQEQPRPEGALRLEHFAFRAQGLRAFVANLERAQVSYRRSLQAGTGLVVLNLHDPDGNRLHIDFAAEEAD